MPQSLNHVSYLTKAKLSTEMRPKFLRDNKKQQITEKNYFKNSSNIQEPITFTIYMETHLNKFCFNFHSGNEKNQYGIVMIIGGKLQFN